jgi:hypothetical protein
MWPWSEINRLRAQVQLYKEKLALYEPHGETYNRLLGEAADALHMPGSPTWREVISQIKLRAARLQLLEAAMKEMKEHEVEAPSRPPDFTGTGEETV